MKHTTWKWAAVAALASVAVYLGTLIATAQQDKKPDPTSQKMDQAIERIDVLSKKLDDLSAKLDAIQKDVSFIKARGKG